MVSSYKLGAIDAGSNALRIVIAESSAPGQLDRIMSERVPVRLGHGAFTGGELDQSTLDAAVSAFVRFRELFDRHGVQRYRAVATSAVRNAHNRDVLLHRLYHEAGIELEVIDGDEEARLIRKAVVAAYRDRVVPRVILDLGGGSLEINYHQGTAWRAASLPIGTVRLLEVFGLTGSIGPEEAGMVRRYAATLLQTVLARVGPDRMPAAACGGNAEAFAKLLGGIDSNGTGFELSALEDALPAMLAASVEERMQRYNVRRDRAEVMGVAALVLATIARGLQLPRLAVPGVGVREALLLDLAESVAQEKSRADNAQGKAVLTAAKSFAHRVGHDITHGEQVRRLAVQLFDQLPDVHGLPPDCRTVLQVAALLHDVGEVVHARSHHKHSEYMIRWGRIAGLESPHREMTAALARTHRKSHPDPRKHTSYGELPKDRQRQVRRLAALLRLADGLDFEHKQRVEAVLASRMGDTIALDLQVRDGRTQRDAAMVRKADLFEAEFGYKVTCTVGHVLEAPTLPSEATSH